MIKQFKFIQLAVIFLTVLAFLPFEVLGQEEDFNIWTRYAVKYDLSSKTRIAVEEEFRFFDNASKLEQNHTELGLSHELSSRWEGAVYYRFIYETDIDRGYSLGHRSWLQLEYRLIDKDLKVSLRSRFQTTITDFFTSEYGRIPELYSRNKLAISYKPKDAIWIPSAGIEYWYFLNPESGNKFIDKYRAGFGLEYRQNKHFRWEAFYHLQQQIQTSDPKTIHVIGLSGTYMIN